MPNLIQRFPLAVTVLGASLSVFLAAPLAAHEQAPEQNEALTAPVTQGVNHIGLTVTDLDASVAFFVDGLGWQRAGGFPDYPSVFVTDGAIFVTLWRASEPDEAIPFDRKNNVGLHHLALTVPDIETLDEIHQRMSNWPGVAIEFAPEPNGGGPTIHMILREPSGNRLEFAVPGGRSRKQAGPTTP